MLSHKRSSDAYCDVMSLENICSVKEVNAQCHMLSDFIYRKYPDCKILRDSRCVAARDLGAREGELGPGHLLGRGSLPG